MIEVRDSDPKLSATVICPRCGFRESLSLLCRTRLCPKCGAVLDIEFLRVWEPRGRGLSRYEKMVPVAKSSIMEEIGSTPIAEVEYRGMRLIFKQEFLNPSGSFKDRGSALALSLARACGIGRVVEDSSGNTAISIALLSRRLGLRARVFIPRDAPEGKKKLLKLLGAEIVECASREEASKKVMEIALRNSNVFYVDHLRNPMYIEGSRTIAYEVYEACGEVGTVIVPVGSGGLFLGIAKGFEDLVKLGLMRSAPKLIAVQGYEVAPLYEAFKGMKPPKMSSKLADGIRVSKPPRLAEMVKVLQICRGEVVLVSDAEIVGALRELIDLGFIVEPTSATVLAALEKLLKHGARLSEPVLLVLTGSGMKMLDDLLYLLG